VFLSFIGFAASGLNSVMFLQDVRHYSAWSSVIAPGTFVWLLWLINAGRIGARLGQRSRRRLSVRTSRIASMGRCCGMCREGGVGVAPRVRVCHGDCGPS
jgi:hypothetical protein